jgi:CRISPR/Cas system-associated endonuclease Cas1
MPVNRQFSVNTNREYWVTQDGRKLYPDQMESSHLVNTLKMLQRNAKKYRLELAREMCEAHYRFGEHDVVVERYYEYFRKEMNMFMDESINDVEWLKSNSKIFCLMIEEAKYRKLDYKEQERPRTEQQVYYTGRPRRVSTTAPTYTWSPITSAT